MIELGRVEGRYVSWWSYVRSDLIKYEPWVHAGWIQEGAVLDPGMCQIGALITNQPVSDIACSLGPEQNCRPIKRNNATERGKMERMEANLGMLSFRA